MGTRVPVVEHYTLRTSNSYIGSSLHDLNADDITGAAGPGGVVGDGGVDRGGDDVTDDSLGNDDDDDPAAVVSDCIHDSYRNALPLQSVGTDDDRSSLETAGSSRGSYNIFTPEDVSPIETARARFLDIIVDHFINPHLVEVSDMSADYASQSEQDNLNKRRLREIQYEGDARFVLPLMYVANLYETLVNEVNLRISSFNGMREKTIGVALEAAGGLYRKLAKKFPRKGPCSFRRRELATSLETRSRFPELVVQEEKRVRFVVVNGLSIVDKPTNMRNDDAEWFRRLTGRTEVAVSAGDYKFYAPRHKYRRAGSSNVPCIPGLPSFPGVDSSPMPSAQGYRSVNEPQSTSHQSPSKQHMQHLPHQPQFHPLQQNHQHHIDQSHQAHYSHNQHCGAPHMSDITHPQQSSGIHQHLACMPTLGHVGGRLHVLPTSPAKYCDECGTPYLRETSKFCSECGTKRLGI
ncbi:OLC1v1024649C2 [Oldenlandia corymbosa var. corymbosa]|uniref:OLC1v1024649C2 n=1 Tax=Oldenlandia corymbosa var. corymbosa TaxID=529605 RepID=A0AAV1C3A6_OLDCO|nr:OLC1v1024649C2 [Oldenlandia corymbosa var. corymbosa]